MDRWIDRSLPSALNPFGQLGAMANTCLIIAVLSGIVLLFWYTPSVHQAYDSLEKIRHSSWLGQLTRSVHRYSSDGCVLFIALHALRIFTQRRFMGARWLAWTTGVALFALLGFIGWTGYWLVWDVRAQHAALGTARFIDPIPIFAEPLSRSFLTDQSVHSLLFFLIFFVHMLAPLAVGVGLWMHLMRVARARFLTGRAMTLWIIGSLLLLSALLPAYSAGPAQMTVKAQRFTMDGWYLWPLVLTDRLSGGLLWAFFLGTGAIAMTTPWWMAKRRATPAWKAEVTLSRCMGCTLCALDCPFNAITMVPREDGKNFAVQSQVNPALCVGCGICTGSCDSQAINLPALNSRDVEKQLLDWIDARKARREPALIAFCCRESAGELWRAGAAHSREWVAYRIEPVPCAGWVSAVLLERLIQRGAAGVLVVGCGPGEPVGREGMKWFSERMAGRREPKFDPGKADPARVRFVQFSRTQGAELRQAALAFRHDSLASGESGPGVPLPFQPRRPLARVATIALLVVGLGGATFALSHLPYRTPHSPEPELVVSFHHSGAILEPRKLTSDEMAKRLPHMRAQINVTRERVPVRLRVQVDGQTVLERAYRPKGLAKDGPSIGVTRLPVSVGKHSVRVEIGDTAEPNVWTKTWDNTLEFAPSRARVILFDAKSGFTVY